MWTSESNINKKFDDFGTELGRGDSSGTWQQDYVSVCAKKAIDGCPFFKVKQYSPTALSCRLINTAVDLASWRAMLVAVSLKNSNIVEIVVHNVRLTTQHLLDLSVVLKNSEILQSIKLDYIELVPEGDERTLGAGFLSLALDATNITYLSFKGNKLSDSFLCSLCDVLLTLPRLESINLSENNISDNSLPALVKILPFSVNLKKISLRSNAIRGGGLTACIQELVHGQPMGATGDHAVKAMQKIVHDKNKAIQASNKTRKKQGLEELPDIPTPASRIVNNPGEENKILNRSFELLDLSHCSFDCADVASLVSAAALYAQTGAEMPEGASPLLIILRGGVDEATRSALASENFARKIKIEC